MPNPFVLTTDLLLVVLVGFFSRNSAESEEDIHHVDNNDQRTHCHLQLTHISPSKERAFADRLLSL